MRIVLFAGLWARTTVPPCIRVSFTCAGGNFAVLSGKRRPMLELLAA
jgi:hypothetical protein